MSGGLAVAMLTVGGTVLLAQQEKWADPPYIQLSKNMTPAVKALPSLGSIDWTLMRIPFIDDSPRAGISGAGMCTVDGRIYLLGGFIPAGDGSGNMWVAERCGVNDCSSRPDIDPILLYSPEGKVLRSFGAGLFLWPHGIYVDHANDVWVTDARGQDGKGHQIHKFSPQGNLLLSLGIAGIGGVGDQIFNAPSDLVVAQDGTIFVADGHGGGGNNRIVKLSPEGSTV